MQQPASSTKFDAEVIEDRHALERRCARLEEMVSELLLKNQELRMLATSLQPEEGAGRTRTPIRHAV